MQSLDELILKLTSATMSGKITWEITSAKNGFQLKLGKNKISIVCCDSYKLANLIGGKDDEIQSGELSILNSNGESIEIYSRNKNDAGFENLKELFVSIRRKVNKVDEVIDEILKELDKVNV